MMKKRMCAVLLALLALAGLAVPAAAAQVDSGTVYCFTKTDFGGGSLAGIWITGLPETGAVYLGERRILPGDILTADQVSQMTFAPADSQENATAQVGYLPIYPDRVEAAAALSIQVMGRKDQAPVAEDSALETYKNLPNEAMLKCRDPEGEAMTYTVTRAPKRGDVVIRADGSFHYTPKKNKVGVDSFTYTAADPGGNVSREATVTITILKPEDAKQYADTAGSSCRFAAEWMKNTGIFVSETVSGNSCFQPEKEVSRGEFLTMLVGALELPLEEDASFTGFTDQVPDWLKPYLAAAMRSGLTAGWPDAATFQADKPITGAEAAVMLQNALDLRPVEGASAPAWAASALDTLAAQGILLEGEAVLTRGQAAQVLYRASQLAKDAPGLLTIRAAQ